MGETEKPHNQETSAKKSGQNSNPSDLSMSPNPSPLQTTDIKARIIDANSRLMAMYRALAAGTSDSKLQQQYLDQEQTIHDNLEELLRSLENIEKNSL